MKKVKLGVALLGGACLLAGCGGGGASLGGPQPPANLVGNWGGGTTQNPAALAVTAAGGTLSFSCGSFETLMLPLTPDAQGKFDVPVTLQPSIPTGGPLPTFRLMGTVYTLTFGQAAPQYTGACPA